MKDLINKIIDLGNEKPISVFLLKSQMIASELGNQEFPNWIFHERNVYLDVKNCQIIGKLERLARK